MPPVNQWIRLNHLAWTLTNNQPLAKLLKWSTANENSVFLANCQVQPPDSPALRALNCRQENLLSTLCFSDIATLMMMYRAYAIECRSNPMFPFLETLAKLKRRFREESNQTLRLRCARGLPLLNVEICTKQSPAKISQWILGLLPPYGSMCTLCSDLHTVSAIHLIRNHGFNPDVLSNIATWILGLPLVIRFNFYFGVTSRIQVSNYSIRLSSLLCRLFRSFPLHFFYINETALDSFPPRLDLSFAARKGYLNSINWLLLKLGRSTSLLITRHLVRISKRERLLPKTVLFQKTKDALSSHFSLTDSHLEEQMKALIKKEYIKVDSEGKYIKYCP